ncbi:MAG: 6-phosphogluconolactonase [Prolixibacteraceae bacterium]|nr:6-phosphogluconolactonase [Prolixibacteraceae bacterium]
MGSSAEVKIYRNPKKVAKAVARELRNIFAESSRPRFDIALSGGNTPKKLLKLLAENYNESLPWNLIHFWWVDERCVAPDDNESNFRIANDLLFSQVLVPEQNIHRIRGENNPEAEAERYSMEISENLEYSNDSPVFDLVILGMGEDGHTASIFPDRLELVNDKRICLATKHPVTGQNRITLSGSVIKNAARIFFMVTGEAKAPRISEIMNNEEAAKLLPAYYLEPENGILIWFLDEPAATKIK